MFAVTGLGGPVGGREDGGGWKSVAIYTFLVEKMNEFALPLLTQEKSPLPSVTMR